MTIMMMIFFRSYLPLVDFMQAQNNNNGGSSIIRPSSSTAMSVGRPGSPTPLSTREGSLFSGNNEFRHPSHGLGHDSLVHQPASTAPSTAHVSSAMTHTPQQQQQQHELMM
jgi:hypothetical protein